MKAMAFKVLFANMAYYNFDINQINVKTVFFYGLNNQLVYVPILKGSESSGNKNMICKQLKALYELKKVSRL